MTVRASPLSVRKQAGFTLIEMIAVLAVIAILAAVIAPPIIEQINRAVADAETQNLTSIAGSLDEYIRANKIIPAASGWVAAVGSVAVIPLSKITSNERNFTRGYYADPYFFDTGQGLGSGYVQNAGRTAAPVSPRIMIVSSLVADAPTAPTAFSVFDATWNQTAGMVVTESADVKIQRIHLGALFHHVLLANNKSDTPQPTYQIEVGTPTSIPVSGTLDRYVLNGSKLSLFLDSGSGGTLNDALLVMADESPLYYTPDGGATWLWKR